MLYHYYSMEDKELMAKVMKSGQKLTNYLCIWVNTESWPMSVLWWHWNCDSESRAWLCVPCTAYTMNGHSLCILLYEHAAFTWTFVHYKWLIFKERQIAGLCTEPASLSIYFVNILFQIYWWTHTRLVSVYCVNLNTHTINTQQWQ